MSNQKRSVVSVATADDFLRQYDFDLVDEMNWEDDPRVEYVSYAAAGLEEDASYDVPAFGLNGTDNSGCHAGHGVPEYVAWWSDGEDSRYSD